MKMLLWVVEYYDAYNKPIKTIFKCEEGIVEAFHNESFLTINVCNRPEGTVVQQIIIPGYKLIKVEMVDLTDPNCPPEYEEYI